jgi:SAM-dependent methyltransferase
VYDHVDLGLIGCAGFGLGDVNPARQGVEVNMSDWYENEAFWRAVYPFLMTEERMGGAADEVDSALSLVGFEGRDVLDLCCGAGRHSVELASQGLTVTGVDRSSFLLGKARALAEEQGVEVEWVEADMRDFVRPACYDLVLNMFTSFGYFEVASDDVKVVENVFRSLRSGGKFLIDVAGKELVAAVFQPTTSDESPDGGLLVRRHEIVDDWSRIKNDWIIIQGGTTTSFTFHLRMYSARELEDTLDRAGFRYVRVFGDLRGGAYGPGAERLIVVAVK